jgi:hypothetical protein
MQAMGMTRGVITIHPDELLHLAAKRNISNTFCDFVTMHFNAFGYGVRQ